MRGRRTGREVEHRGHTAGGLKPKEGGQRPARGRQQHANPFARTRAPGQHAAERKARGDEPAIGHRRRSMSSAIACPAPRCDGPRAAHRTASCRSARPQTSTAPSDRQARDEARRDEPGRDAFGGRELSRREHPNPNTGKQRRLTFPPSREKGVNSAPSICTVTSAARVRSAITAGPSYTFISEPVVVMRPSGKMMQAEPASTARIIARIESGLVGSTGSAWTSDRTAGPTISARKGVHREDRIPGQERAEEQPVEE